MTVCQECGINTLIFNGNHSPGCSQYDPNGPQPQENAGSEVWVSFIEGTKERGISLSTGILAKHLVSDINILDSFTDKEKLEIVLGDDIEAILDLAVWAGVIACLQTTMEQGFLNPESVEEYISGSDLPDPEDW